MSLIVQDDYANQIWNREFGKVIKLLREGKISVLNQEAQIQLAYYLENSKGTDGKHKRDFSEFSEHLYTECKSLEKYGMTTADLGKYFSEHATKDNYKEILHALGCKGMTNTAALEYLAGKECLSSKSIQARITEWKKHIGESGRKVKK